MELAMIAGIGLVGYYFNQNDDGNDHPRKRVKILSNNIPNGFDVYNQNRLSLSEEKERDLAEMMYEKSQYPKETNIIPNYYNQFGPMLIKSNFNNSKYSKISQLYDVDEDLDDIYADVRTGENYKLPNDIYKPQYYDRDTMLLSDKYDEYKSRQRNSPLIIPGVGKVAKRTYVDKNTQMPVNRQTKRITGADTFTVEGFAPVKKDSLRYLDPDNDSQDLLAVSESLTDNANSMRAILAGNPNWDENWKIPSPEQDFRTKRLIGVTPNYQSNLVDDETARYPNPSDCGDRDCNAGLRRSDKTRQFPVFRDDHEEPTEFSDYPSFLVQFDDQRFDNRGLPSAPNDVYKSNNKSTLAGLERQLSYQGGWAQYDNAGAMSYGVVPEDQLTHDNMMPYFSFKTGYGTNDLLDKTGMNEKRELFTGNLTDTWHKKKEIPRMFTPVGDLSYVYGTPIRPEGEESRYPTGRFFQNELLADPLRVTPGLNLNYDEIGTQGYFDMVRALPKTVDELRTSDNPKITYEGRIIDGMKGEARSVQAPVISYRPDGFKVTTEADLLPTSDLNKGPKTRDNYIMKEQSRPEQQIEYTGGAYSSSESVGQNVPESMRPKVKYSAKPIFTLPKPLQKFARTETQFNPNLNSYENQATIRSTTGQTEHFGPVTNTSGMTTYANQQDVARSTIKETTASEPQKFTFVGPNTMRGTVHNMDIANPTIKETTIENKLNPYAVSLNTMQRVYVSDVMKPTIKETTEQAIVPSNIASDNHNIYANWSDNQKITMKQTTVEIPRNTEVFAIGQSQRTPNYQDLARNTIKETTVAIPQQTVVTPVNQQQRAPNCQDLAKTTLKESTVQIPYQTMVTPVGQSQRTPNYQDVTRTTLKESTVQIPYQTMVTPVGQSQRTPNYQDLARTTMKESTVEIPYQTMVTPVGQSQRTPNYQDMARTTVKESTVQIPYQTVVTAVGQSQRAPDYQDTARTTLKEETVQIPHNTFAVGVNQSQRAPNYQDLARTTIKEETVQIPHNTNLTAVNQAQRAPNYQDEAKITNRQFTVQESFVQGPHGDNRPKSYADAYNAQMDDRKEMLQIYYPPTTCNTNLGPDKERMNIYVRNDDTLNNTVNMGYSINNQQDRPQIQGSINAPKLNVPRELYINPKILEQLDSNPYNIPYFGQIYD